VSVVVVGANHRSAPLELLELMTVDRSRLVKVLASLAAAEHISEAVVLSTCNRTEVYLVAERFHGAYDEARDVFADLTYLPPERFADSLYVHHDDDAVRHLFAVAAGLDSAVPGEHEVLGQLRGAWEAARDEGVSGRQLNALFRHAVEVGKRARTETAIAQGVTSVPQAAVVIAADHLGSLRGRDALLVGAGSMGRSVGGFLLDAGVASLTVANRSIGTATDLVAELGSDDCVAVELDRLGEVLGRVDLVVTATSAPDAVVSADLVEAGRAGTERPLLVVDIGLPRDVDPAAGRVDGVTLLDLHAVTALTDASLAERHREVVAVQQIVEQELARFAAVASAREVDPVVRAMRDRFEEVRRTELDRSVGRLSPEQAQAVEEVTRSLVAKLLHEPTVSLKRAAGTSLGDRLAESVRDLFDLVEPGPAPGRDGGTTGGVDRGDAPEQPPASS